MIRGNVKAEQVKKDGSVVVDFDQKYTIEEQNALIKRALGSKAKLTTIGNKECIKYTHGNEVELILTLNLTYLGHPHPLYKKRAQLKNWYSDFYREYNKDNTKVRILGIYKYEDNVIYSEFVFDTYLQRRLNNSSAHVYTNDFYQTSLYGSFERIDKNNNVIKFVRGDLLKKYLDGETLENSTIYQLFSKFNNEFMTGNWILASDAIKEMKDANFYQWRGTEWAGWFLEFKMNQFIDDNNCEDKVAFVANIKDKLKKPLDFDLYFSEEDYYGDLKSSDEAEKQTPGNDQFNLMKTVLYNQKFWYIIYEHKTEKDIDHNSEMAIARMELLGTSVEEYGKISYKDRMKHSVRYTNMKILEVNSANFREFMSDFTQGHQPDGSARMPKFKIDKRNIDNFIIFSQRV